MAGPGPVALLDLASEGSRFVARVLGRYGPGAPHAHDWLVLEWVVESPFVSGAVQQTITRHDLEDWERALARLDAGQDASWLTESGRTPELRIRWVEPGEPVIEVEVDDGVMSGAKASVVLLVDDGWVEELRLGLSNVRETWPAETAELSPGVYTWVGDQAPQD